MNIIATRGGRGGQHRATPRRARRLAGMLVLCAFAAGPASAQASRVSGDFNCDGFDDLAIGVPTENVANGAAPNVDAGAVNVVYGSSNRLTATSNQLWTQQSLEGGAEPGDRFGSAVAAGDFNNDGCDDLAVGVPGENLPFNGATVLDAGAVNVIKGSAIGLTASGNALWTQDPLAGSPEAGDKFGSSLAVGRFKFSDFEDLAVGVPGEDDGAGAVNVVFGAGGGGLTSSGNTVRAQGLQGPGTAEPGDAFGSALATGDFDDDGYDDLAIGVPLENEEFGTLDVNSGTVNVIYGATLSLSTTRFQVWRQIWDTWDDGDHYGSALATGDFDDDGHADLAVGAPGEDHDSGAVSVIYGKGPGPERRRRGLLDPGQPVDRQRRGVRARRSVRQLACGRRPEPRWQGRPRDRRARREPHDRRLPRRRRSRERLLWSEQRRQPGRRAALEPGHSESRGR